MQAFESRMIYQAHCLIRIAESALYDAFNYSMYNQLYQWVTVSAMPPYAVDKFHNVRLQISRALNKSYPYNNCNEVLSRNKRDLFSESKTPYIFDFSFSALKGLFLTFTYSRVTEVLRPLFTFLS